MGPKTENGLLLSTFSQALWQESEQEFFEFLSKSHKTPARFLVLLYFRHHQPKKPDAGHKPPLVNVIALTSACLI